MAVTTNLPALRAVRKLTQAELATALAVSRQTINSIETGRFEPSLSLALKVAAYFDMPVEAIFTLAE